VPTVPLVGGAAARVLGDAVSFYQHALFYTDLLGCQRCPIRQEATRVVPGVGPLDARILLLGQNPGDREDKSGEPFLGKAGDELNTWLSTMRLVRASLAITNVVKCRTHENRAPKNKEVQFCRDQWLPLELTALAKVDVLIPFGKPALYAVLGTALKPPSGIEPWYTRVKFGARELLVTPLPHPAYILRAQQLRADLLRRVLPAVAEIIAREVPEAYARHRG
jgi:uracil-DNA glycosylase family 4